MLGGVDEEDVVGLFAAFEDEDAHRNTRGIKQVRGQADDGVDVTVFEEFGADAFFGAAAEEDAVRQDDGHDAFFLEEMEAVQEKSEIGGGFGREAVVFEADVFAEGVGGFPAEAEGRIGDDGVEAGHFGGVGFAEKIPIVLQGVAVMDFELGVFYSVEEHVHARQVVGGDVVFLSVDFADAVLAHAFADVEEEGAGAAGEVENAVEVFPLAGFGFLAVEGDDGGEDAGDLLGGVEFAGFFAGAGGELADEVFVGVAERVDVGGKFCESVGDSFDDGAEFGVSVCIFFAEFFGDEVDFGEEALEGAFEGFVFDVFEAVLEGLEQFAVLGARHVGDVFPEVLGSDDVVYFAAHLFFKVSDVAGVVGIPDGKGHAGDFDFGRFAFDFDLDFVFVSRGWVIAPEFLFGGGGVVFREVAQKEEGEHVVAEVVRVHATAQIVGDFPKGFS